MTRERSLSIQSAKQKPKYYICTPLSTLMAFFQDRVRQFLTERKSIRNQSLNESFQNKFRIVLLKLLDFCQYFDIHNNDSYFLLKLLVVAVVFLCEIEAWWLVGKNGDDENCPKRSKEFILDSFSRVYNNKLNLSMVLMQLLLRIHYLLFFVDYVEQDQSYQQG